ncbi:MAG: TraR/DksA family transcriptional regulator, partial [Thermodesulfobacteriota bacterium]
KKPVLSKVEGKTPAKKKTAVKKPAAKKKAAPKTKTIKKSPHKASQAVSRGIATGSGRQSFKKEMLKTLLASKRRLLEEVTNKVKAESNTSKFEIGDIYDIASNERERELILTLGDREREQLHEVNVAIERLNKKDYGECEECNEPIGEERLRALPFTRVCVDCKTKFEKESRAKGRFEEEAAIAIAESNEGEEEEY